MTSKLNTEAFKHCVKSGFCSLVRGCWKQRTRVINLHSKKFCIKVVERLQKKVSLSITHGLI